MSTRLAAQLAARAGVQRALAALDAEQVLQWALEIQQIPAPTFAEAKRAAYVAARFRALGLADVEVDALHNVYARCPGAGGAPAVLVSAHTDTVFPAETDLGIRREGNRVYGPGLGDNSLAVAGLLALPTALQAAHLTPPGDLWLVANSGEEGLGDLRGMRAVVDRLGEQVAATIVLEGLSYGQVCNAGIGVRRYRITAECDGGHSWLHYGVPSAIHHLMRLGTRLAGFQLPRDPRTTLNIGVVRGGTSINTIAARASMDVDLRSMDTGTLAELIGRVEQGVAEAGQRGVRFTIETIGDRPFGQLRADHPLVQLSMAAVDYCSDYSASLDSSSTDANIPLSRQLPAVCIGLTRGGNAHRLDEYIDLDALPNGLQQLLLVTLGAFELS